MKILHTSDWHLGQKFISLVSVFLLLTMTTIFGCSYKTVHLTNDTLFYGDNQCATYELQLNPDSSFCQKIEICDIALPTICCGKYTYNTDTLILLTDAKYYLQKNTLVNTTDCEKGKVIFRTEGYPFKENSNNRFISDYYKILAQKIGKSADTITIDEYLSRKNGQFDIAVKLERIKDYDYVWLDGLFFKGVKLPIAKVAECMEIVYPVIQRDWENNQENCLNFYAMKPRIIKQISKKNYKFLFLEGGKMNFRKIK